MKKDYPKIYIYKRVVQAKLFIDAHFGDDIDLGNIADEAYFSKFHFIRLFKTMYDKTPHQYLIKVRIENAEALLQKGVSVAETCFDVGFNSVSSFTGLFKKFTKLSPAAYQQHYKKRREQISQVPLQFIPNCFAKQNGWSQKSNIEEVI